MERDKSGALSFPGGSSAAIAEAAGANPHSRYFLRLTFLRLVEEDFEISTHLLSFSRTSWYRMGNCAGQVGGGESVDRDESMDWALPDEILSCFVFPLHRQLMGHPLQSLLLGIYPGSLACIPSG